MTKILKSLMVIVAVAAIATGATSAYFSDEETVTGMTFASGTLSITDSSEDWTKTVSFTNWQPGSSARKWVTITNDGTLDVDYLTVNAAGVSGDTDLLNAIKISATGAVSGSDAAYFTPDWTGGATILPWMSNANMLDDPSYYRTPAGVIHPGESYTMAFDFSLPTTVGNELQGKSASFDMVFHAEQSH